jgi:tetratricopeptide (TPR) repeat protein
MVEPLPGLSWLQISGVAAALAAILLVRRTRAAARRRRSAPRPEDLATQTALVAAWTLKGSSLLDRPAPGDGVVTAPARPAAPAEDGPAADHEPGDPSAAADFVAWGRQAARAGDREIAQRLLSQAVHLDPNSEEGWLWLAGTCERPEDAIHCLRRVLAINPENAWARRGLGELQPEDRP